MSHVLDGSTNDPMSIWEEVEKPTQQAKDAAGTKTQPSDKQKPEKKN